MLLSGTIDKIEGPQAASVTSDGDGDGVVNEIPQSIVDFEEFYLLHYFKPGTQITPTNSSAVTMGRATFTAIGCVTCHKPTFTIASDRRVADLETNFSDFNPMTPTTSGNPFNRHVRGGVAVPRPPPTTGSGLPTLKRHSNHSFVVRNIFTDFKRHDLGAELPRAELRGDAVDAVHHRAPVGRVDDGAVRA